MGSQWCGMGKSLMIFSVFRETIERCHNILKPYGVDLVSIITSDDKKSFDHIINSFVGIAAIQIGLVNILRLLDIPMDLCVGHSVGELACAYADSTLTDEQMILAAYARGLVSFETEVILGAMAAVGLGYEKIKDILPPNVAAACHNNFESTTISGTKADVYAFVDSLKAQGIFAKEVPCSVRLRLFLFPFFLLLKINFTLLFRMFHTIRNLLLEWAQNCSLNYIKSFHRL